MKRQSKRVLIIMLALVLLVMATMVGCDNGAKPVETEAPTAAPEGSDTPEASEEPDKPLTMVMITDAGGLGDKGFNDIIWEGMVRAGADFGFDVHCIESSEAAHYGPNITSAAEEGYDIVVLVGFLFTDILPEIAPLFPDTHFVMIDGTVEGDNVYSFKFHLEESGYLAGALAGLKSESNKFGVVGGIETPDVVAWESGFAAGIMTTRPDAEISITYVGSFGDPGKAKELALAHYDAGADIVMEISSGGAVGVAEGAADAGKYFVATDKSKDSLAPGSEFTAALAKRDEAVYAVAKLIKEGKAEAGVTWLSTKDNIFSLPDDTAERYGADTMAIIDKLQGMIRDGDLTVPMTKEDVASFVAPEY